ncbi:RNA-binding S4 domain-containing protein [Halodurantibacterium flavum]|uniref:RNA-binding S4 domain-containing protein n=1 Tax=Halodurantibacterium flavum TaxID=1382802 RepID=A0ABW4S475_9RHOB
MRETVRLDKWLWFTRFFKTRGLAARFIETGKIRINSQPVAKTSAHVGAGDVLTFPLGGRVRVVQVAATGMRRGPATEAQALYFDLDAPAHAVDVSDADVRAPDVPAPNVPDDAPLSE